MNTTKVMIVEDNTMVAEDCRDCLESLGYTVTSIVSSGEESVEKAGDENPDAVIMDIHLRDEMNGIEAAGQIYSRFEIPVIFLSAYSDRELLERARRVGAFGYLVKPFNERELFAMIEMALYKAQMEKEQRQMEARLRQVRKMEAIATLAGGIAHQFNNALYVVAGSIDLLQMHFPFDKKVTRYAKPIQDSVRQMTQLVSQLLAYARGGKYQIQTVSLNDFIRNSFPLLKQTIPHGILVETDLPRDIHNIKADPTQMEMLFSAVLLNASEAMGGAGILRITCKNTMITDSTLNNFPGLKRGHYVKLAVTDNGKGMDKETAKQIFEPFFSTKFQGRGLGMAAVYGIVKNHGGWISVDSEPGRGTRVEILLPATRIMIQETEKAENERITGTGTILIIEDDEMLMPVCREILEELGYHVLEAGTGEKAIDMARSYEGDIDLALLDIFLPDMNGDEIYPYLMEARPKLKVIICSGYAMDGPGAAREILDAGARGFLQKPFSIELLSEKLQKALADE